MGRSKTIDPQKRRARLDRSIARYQQQDSRFTWARLLVFFVGGFLALALAPESPGAAALAALLTVAIFFAILARHRKLRAMLFQFRLWRELHDDLDARAALNWAKLRPALRLPLDPDHPFAADLDLTGDRSLFRLLDTPVALEGSARLRDRLISTPASEAEVLARQALVRELVPLAHFRRRLALSARLVINGAPRWEARRLLTWIDAPARNLRPVLLLTSALALADAVLLVLDALGVLPSLWMATFVAYVGVTLWQMRSGDSAFEEAAALQDALVVLVAVSRRLERHVVAANSPLADLLRPFRSTRRPTVQLRRAALLATAASVGKNPMLSLLFNVALPWDILIAHLLDRYRASLAVDVPAWLDAWFELETACALATFAELHPAYAFPKVAPDAVFRANALGHPLIADGARVCNDFAAGQLGEVVLITGSNMSGKSSFLRTLGVNLCLAYAGAPVCAQALDVRLFRLYTSIHVNDSLADGFSYFYAEVRRLRALLTALEADDPLPLFFLIDEIFRGTNNQERLIGSRAYVQALGGKRGVGVISTHDLELTTLPGLVNYHFEDQVIDGKMSFDYTLRPGRSPSTNALKIMRLAGLPVDVPSDTPVNH